MSKAIGTWFEGATVSKTAPITTRCSLLLFYHYARPPLPSQRLNLLKTFLSEQTNELGLGGRLRVASEGLNCTISGTSESVRTFSERLALWGSDVTSSDSTNSANSTSNSTSPPFSTADFKFIDDLPPDRAFKDCKILPVNELVFYGVGEHDAPLDAGGVHLDPKDYHEKMKQPNTVIIDVRNSYEADIGKFTGQNDGAATGTGATYIDPKMRKSTDFKQWLEKPETREQLTGKTVMMYCTGGVRCERASALLKTQMAEAVPEVYQLQGGIEKYMQEFPDGGFWRGKNFVFDKREAFGADNLAGVGGVVEGKKKKKKNKGDDPNIMGQCCVCNKQWDRYIGKKKCYTCGVPVLMCDSCMSLKPDKATSEETKLTVRCPLCKEEGIVVPAADQTFTNNGIDVDKKGGKAGASTTVLKWGGGHAKEKKKERTLKRTGKDKECKFGDACSREGCWFSHPRDGGGGGKKQKL
jgi:predicted sulfurtransferase